MTHETIVSDPYYSRLESQWEAAPREDPVVWSDGAGPLSPQDLQTFAKEGYRFVGDLFDECETSVLRSEALSLAMAATMRTPGVIIESGTQQVRSIFRLHRNNALFGGVCRDPRIVEPVRQILGSDVYIHQSRINFKPALDGKEFFWHSDFETWHIEDGLPRMRTVSVSLNLTDNNEFNGPLMVVPRSHETFVRCVGATPDNHYEQSLKKQEYGVPSREALELLVQRGGITAPKGPPGSATFFDCNLMHGSVGNLSPFPRINFFMVFNSVENGLVEPFGGKPPRPDYLAEREIVPIDRL
jgi:ectoine hydroxylase